MTGAAVLPKRLVAQKAESIFSHKRHRFAALLEGRGDADRVRVGDIDVEIVPTTCELELRRKMAEREGRGGAALYLLDWTLPTQLARDLRARVAEGKVYRIGREERLRQVFSAKRLGIDLTSSPLAELAMQGEVDEFPQSPRLTLDLPLACFTWLEKVLGEPFSRATAREADFIAACDRSDGRDLMRRAEQGGEWRRWLDRVAAILEEHVSPLSGLVWRAWLAGQLHAVPAVLWVVEAFAQGNPHPRDRKLLHNALQQRYPTWAAAAEALPVTADGATVTAWDAVLRRGDAAPPRGLDELAEAVGTDDLFCASIRMPAGLAARETALADALERLVAGVRKPGSDDGAWADAAASFASLREHRVVRTSADRGATLDMLQRLAAWLWEVRHRPAVPSAAPVPAALELAARFCRDGGYVDRARRVSGRGPREGALGRAWSALRELVEERRDAQEQAFALGMREWAEGGRAANGCVPIERASREFVAEFLTGAPKGAGERRLLVLLMDGMSWARCRELCDSLRVEGWEALRWRPRSARGGALPPVLAAFPTITSVSRSAFFAGELPPSGAEPQTRSDPERWRTNPAVKDFAGASGQLELFMKDRVEGERGLPTPEVLDAITDPERPLVAAVVNTIDDALKTTPSLEFSTGLEDIKPLRDLLARARDAKRAVLLIADHGHVLGERFERVATGKEAGGARWRLHDEVRPLQPHEVLLERGAWSPDPALPIVALAGERAQYSIHSHHGEHGGLSLAEVVAPAVLLGTVELVETAGGTVPDPELEIAAPDEPGWWRDLAPAVVDAVAAPARMGTGSLFKDLGTVETASPPPRPSRAVATPRWVTALKGSPAFKTALSYTVVPQKDRDKLAEHALLVARLLVESGGRASARSIAQAADVALGRVGGLIARVRSVLNAEGETCLTEDRATDSVLLDLERFRSVFGVDPEGG